MVSLRHQFKDPLIISLGATLGLHLVFFIGICVLMAEEYYTLGSYGCRHHRRHHKHHVVYQQSGGAVGAVPQAIPEPDERFVTRDEDTNTYRLSPDLVKAFKSLDIAPVVVRVKKSKRAKKLEIIKEKPVRKAEKQKIQASKKLHKKPMAPVHVEEKKISVAAAKKLAPILQQGSSQGTPAGTKVGAPIQAKKQSIDVKSTAVMQHHVQVKAQTGTPVAAIEVAKPVAAVQQAVVDEEEVVATTSPVAESEDVGDDNDAYEDDEAEGSDDDALFETDTLSLAASDARGGMLSARQSKAAKQLSEHMVKQWRPPAGCHDASAVHVEVAVQHDGRIESKFIKTSSMPILNFAVKRMVAQLTTKAVQDMMESARGTKLILIFKG